VYKRPRDVCLWCVQVTSLRNPGGAASELTTTLQRCNQRWTWVGYDLPVTEQHVKVMLLRGREQWRIHRGTTCHGPLGAHEFFVWAILMQFATRSE